MNKKQRCFFDFRYSKLVLNKLNLCLFILLCLIGVPEAAANTQYNYKTVECSFSQESWFEPEVVQCGELSFFENTAFKLPVVVIKQKNSLNTAPKDSPLFFINGGPGGSSIFEIKEWLDHKVRPYADIVLMDQRGTGQSEPQLCPGLSTQVLKLMSQNLSIDKEISQKHALAKTCLKSIEPIQPVLSTASMIKDIDALRLALDYQKINLYGVSYGTRVAVHYAVEYQQSLNKLILDSVVPAHEGFYNKITQNFHQSLKRIEHQCGADNRCQQKYANIIDKILETVKQLEQKPAVIDMPHARQYADGRLILNAHNFIFLLQQLLYSKEFLPILPLLVSQAHEGNYQQIAFIYDLLVTGQANVINFATYYAVLGKEELPFTNIGLFQRGDDELTSLPALAFFEADIAFYHEFKALFNQKSALLTKQVIQGILTDSLVMAGSFDPMTPAQYGKALSELLPNATYHEFASAGHGVTFSDRCAKRILTDFIAGPPTNLAKNCIDKQKSSPFATTIYESKGLFQLINSLYYDGVGAVILPGAAVSLLLIVILLVVLRFIVTIIRKLLQRKRQPSPNALPTAVKITSAYLLLAGVVTALAITVLAMFGMKTMGFSSLLYGWPKQVVFLVPILIVTCISLIYIAKALAISWVNLQWTLSGRIYVSAVFVSNVILILFLLQWGLLWA